MLSFTGINCCAKHSLKVIKFKQRLQKYPTNKILRIISWLRKKKEERKREGKRRGGDGKGKEEEARGSMKEMYSPLSLEKNDAKVIILTLYKILVMCEQFSTRSQMQLF